MKLTFRTIKQESFEIEVEGTDKISAVKKKIQETKGPDFPAEAQKLIYSGKVLADESTVAEHNIDVSKFLVVMVTGAAKKAEAAATTTPAGTTPVPSTANPSVPASADAGAAAPSVPAETGAPAAAPDTAAPAAPAAAPAAAAAVPEAVAQFAGTVDSICAMGYERNQVEAAVRLAFGNAERAVEYLVSGIPDSALSALGEEAAEEAAPEGAEPPAGGGPAGGPLDFLRSQPQFEQMRQMVRANPQLLQAAMQQLGAANPDLLQMISQNQEEFIRLINEADAPAAPAGDAAPGAAPPGVVTIALSESDRASILRLRELGFSEAAAVQAFIACERNEEAAANFLFDQADDD